MSKFYDEMRSAMGLPPEGENREPSTFKKATAAAVRSVMQLGQHQIYAGMNASSMGTMLDEQGEQGRVVTETTTRRVSSRRVPDVEDFTPTENDYEFVPGT